MSSVFVMEYVEVSDPKRYKVGWRSTPFNDENLNAEIEKLLRLYRPKIVITERRKPVMENFDLENFNISPLKRINEDLAMHYTSYKTPDTEDKFLKSKPRFQSCVLYTPTGSIYNSKYDKRYIKFEVYSNIEEEVRFAQTLRFWDAVATEVAKKHYQTSGEFLSPKLLTKQETENMSSMNVKVEANIPIYDAYGQKLGTVSGMAIKKQSLVRVIFEVTGFVVRQGKISTSLSIAQIQLLPVPRMEEQSMFVNEHMDYTEEVLPLVPEFQEVEEANLFNTNQ